MTKVKKKAPQRSGSRHHHHTNPYHLRSLRSNTTNESPHTKSPEKKDWQDATCPVCMEYPHNAVLLLCSSHHQGCRPYMCATSYRYSNCLDQYKKAYTKPKPGPDGVLEKPQEPELLCPLCRGSVKGWTVVDRAREFLDSKKRSCMQEKCLFVGSYRDLRKHMRADHPWARPTELDPTLVEKWKTLENDQERNDVMSTISATMPGSIIMGDYVIEGNFRGFSMENYLEGVVYSWGSNDVRSGLGGFLDDEMLENDQLGGGHGGGPSSGRARSYISQAAHRQGRAVVGGSRRRRVRGVGM